jgi:hypothetical protein
MCPISYIMHAPLQLPLYPVQGGDPEQFKTVAHDGRAGLAQQQPGIFFRAADHLALRVEGVVALGEIVEVLGDTVREQLLERIFYSFRKLCEVQRQRFLHCKMLNGMTPIE